MDILSDYLRDLKKSKVQNLASIDIDSLFPELFGSNEWIFNMYQCMQISENVGIASKFADYMRKNSTEIGAKIGALIVETAPQVLTWQSEWILLCRVAVRVPVPDVSSSLWTVLTLYGPNMERDVVTQTAHLLAKSGASYDTNELGAIPQMALKRYAPNAREERVHFFLQHTGGECGMELHYAIQSIELVLPKKGRILKSLALTLISLVFKFWDHPWQMVATHCRSLFLRVLELVDKDTLRDVEILALNLAEGSKRKFNAIFALAPFVGKEIFSPSLIEETVKGLEIGSPSAAGASQLLVVMLCMYPELIETVAKYGIDSDLLYQAVCKSVDKKSKLRHPLLALNHKLVLPFAAAEGLLRVVDRESLFLGDTQVGTYESVSAQVLSGNSDTVTRSVSTLLRSGLWPDLVLQFIENGGIAVIGCCNDDRAILVQDFSNLFFSKNRDLAITSTLMNALLVAAIEGTLLEESQLTMEVLLGISSRKKFEKKFHFNQILLEELLVKSLSSRWNPIRGLARKLIHLLEGVAQLGEPTESDSDEVLGVWFDFNVGNIDEFVETLFCEKDSAALMAFANSSSPKVSESVAIKLAAHCLDQMKEHAVLLGPDSDCRGHPIIPLDGKISSEKISHIAWTCIKYSSMSLVKVLVSSMVEEIGTTLTSLLLSLKHPAAIAPVQVCFEVFGKKFPDWVDQNVVFPLIKVTTDSDTSGSVCLPVALRRSQGLGALMLACVKSVPTSISFVINELLSCMQRYEKADSVLHSMNILRALVKDAGIHERVLEPFIGRISEEALAVLEIQADWRIRSSATQLFVHAVRRVIGADHLGRKRVSCVDFFRRSKKLECFFKSILSKIMIDESTESLQVTVLSVLQSLGDIDTETLNLIKFQMTQSPSMHVRRLAARIVARNDTLESMVEDIMQTDALKLNELHGRLMCIEFGIRKNPAFVFSVKFILKIDKPNLPTIVQNLIHRIVPNRSCIASWDSLKDCPVSRLALAEKIVDNAELAASASSFWCKRNTDDSHLGMSGLLLWLEQKDDRQVEENVNEWLHSICLFDDIGHSKKVLYSNLDVPVKIRLAQSKKIIPQQFPDLHVLLNLDEDPLVRQSEFNPTVTFARLASTCSLELLHHLAEIPSEGSYASYCIRPRSLVEKELARRGRYSC